ncbi:hypothetical protein [Flavihumibacter sp. CACIAM 22H1]|uniref:hypothetical protein n=1 Tax=Flavihumibacter sp. CACIAM 22H1 TaxID=1812911 RepID=UPI0007A87560|nr:hypothetical protein [Flavihumibacter sp. CACIAM 22H1]KYP15806.1 MAG: hypothetical protein A1D16_10285 [Flavihumibacter sp. CACIAM 22H1]
MNKKKNIQEQVAATLSSLDGLERASANPHLYTRIRAKLDQELSSWSWIAAFLSRPVVAIGLVAVIIILNILTITSNKKGTEELNDQLVTLAQDYSFQPSNILENGINQP